MYGMMISGRPWIKLHGYIICFFKKKRGLGTDKQISRLQYDFQGSLRIMICSKVLLVKKSMIAVRAPTDKQKNGLFNYENTLFHKNCCISLNIGPIFKIRSLACSALQCQSAWRQWRHARRNAREMTSRATSTWRHHGHETRKPCMETSLA